MPVLKQPVEIAWVASPPSVTCDMPSQKQFSIDKEIPQISASLQGMGFTINSFLGLNGNKQKLHQWFVTGKGEDFVFVDIQGWGELVKVWLMATEDGAFWSLKTNPEKDGYLGYRQENWENLSIQHEWKKQFDAGEGKYKQKIWRKDSVKGAPQGLWLRPVYGANKVKEQRPVLGVYLDNYYHLSRHIYPADGAEVNIRASRALLFDGKKATSKHLERSEPPVSALILELQFERFLLICDISHRVSMVILSGP